MAHIFAPTQFHQYHFPKKMCREIGDIFSKFISEDFHVEHS